MDDHDRAILLKVVAYLDPTQRELYGSRDAWNAMQDAVVTTLEATWTRIELRSI